MTRPFAPVSAVRAGTKIVVDGGFTCVEEGERHVILEDDDGLYFECRAGHHYLDGQLSDDELTYVGVYLENAP